MKYNIEWVKKKYESRPNIKYIFFWGHRPNPDGSIGKSCFSQWWESEFEQDDLTFRTAEHWMMYKKAELFDDMEIARRILDVRSPAEAKKLGRQVKNFDEMTWLKHRSEIVVKGNCLKFSQHDDHRDFLLKTGTRILVEASPVDNIWGIGLAKDADNIQDPYTWKGLNLLGFALMEVRDRLSEEE